ncbi:MAG: hypothetical protein ACYDG3_14930 [Bacillati bacterium]
MKSELSEYWHTYFCHASAWTDGINEDMYSSIIAAIVPGVHIPSEIISIGKPFFVKAGNHDMDGLAEYIDNPSKCTPNPYVYHSMKNIKELDLKWVDIVIRNRTDNYDKVSKELSKSADELSHPIACYDGDEIANMIKDMM